VRSTIQHLAAGTVFAGLTIDVLDGQLLGALAIRDELRPESAEVVAVLQRVLARADLHRRDPQLPRRAPLGPRPPRGMRSPR
jgi:hypothetical protein